MFAVSREQSQIAFALKLCTTVRVLLWGFARLKHEIFNNSIRQQRRLKGEVSETQAVYCAKRCNCRNPNNRVNKWSRDIFLSGFLFLFKFISLKWFFGKPVSSKLIRETRSIVDQRFERFISFNGLRLWNRHFIYSSLLRLYRQRSSWHSAVTRWIIALLVFTETWLPLI